VSVEDILYSPIENWRQLCQEIVLWIDRNRRSDRSIYQVDRPRPTGALYLLEFVEAYREHGQKIFWRIQYPDIYEFEFDGIIEPAGPQLEYPAYGEVGSSHFRSIEDANLVANTYTSYFIFRSTIEAHNALAFVSAQNKI
jgi:hypothetical protein